MDEPKRGRGANTSVTSAATPTVIVLAKEPVPGRVKTRLAGSWSHEQVAALAEAALADTLHTVAAWDCAPLCVLEGATGPWLPAGVPVVPQVAGSLGDRIAAAFGAAFERAAGPVLLVGMDTPQLSHRHLDLALAALDTRDACLGPAVDGGWWLLGLRAPAPAAIAGVPTSRDDTGARQRQSLLDAGLTVADLPMLVDVDTPPDAHTVAAGIPGSRFARLLASLEVAA